MFAVGATRKLFRIKKLILGLKSIVLGLKQSWLLSNNKSFQDSTWYGIIEASDLEKPAFAHFTNEISSFYAI